MSRQRRTFFADFKHAALVIDQGYLISEETTP